jgi:hypothetical protein
MYVKVAGVASGKSKVIAVVWDHGLGEFWCKVIAGIPDGP